MTDTDYKPVAQGPQQMTTSQLLKRLTPEIARALPRGMDADRIARLVMTEIRKNPKLTDCTQQSFAGALLTASALGLEPGVNGECYLVPYRNKGVMECQLILGYQGIAKLFWQSPHAARLSAEWVGANDEFGYRKGLTPELWHRHAKDERGEPVAYYAIVQIKGAEPIWDVFTPQEIQKLRRGKVGSSGDIPDPMHWMERKTALKQVLKLAPKSTRLDLAVRSDERGGSDLYRSQGLEVPALPESPTEPDFIEGEFTDADPSPDNPEVEMVTGPQTTKLAIIREERYPKTAKGRADWFKWVAGVIKRDVDSNTQLTMREAGQLLDLLEPPEELAQ